VGRAPGSAQWLIGAHAEQYGGRTGCCCQVIQAHGEHRLVQKETVRRAKARTSRGLRNPPGKLSLQPVVIGAAVEVTKRLKPSV
jgi:hypothetical protein